MTHTAIATTAGRAARRRGSTGDAIFAALVRCSGGFVLLLVLVPNPMRDRLLIVLVGGVIATAGLILRSIAKRIRKKIELGERAPI